MAPEQAEGRADMGLAVDIYALGAVLYECLTGRPPFKGSSVPETLRQVVNDQPVPVRTLMPGVPRDLETIVHRCLHKESGGRYATAQDLADDLGRFLRGEAIHARPVSWLERTVRWTLLHKALAGLIGVSALALVVVLALAFYFTATLSAERTRSEQAEKEAQTRQFFALRSQAIERAASRRMGWSWKNLEDLTEAAKLPVADEYLPELRSEVLAALTAVDVHEEKPLLAATHPMAVAADPQGRWVAISEQGNTIGDRQTEFMTVVLVDPVTDRILRHLRARQVTVLERPGSPDAIYVLTFTRDGRWLLGGSRSGWVHIWDMQTEDRDPVRTIAREGHNVVDLECSPDNRWLYASYTSRG